MEYKSSLDGTLFTGLVMEDTPPTKTPTTEDVMPSLVYRIQIAASTKKIETASYNFKGLTPISRLKKGNLYRYYYGNFSSYSAAMIAVKNVKLKGYKGAYVKAFENGNEVSITPEMKST